MTDTQFWDFLLSKATAIAELDPSRDDGLAEVMAHLESIDVVFERSFDPADAYEEYTALALCSAIQKALARTSPNR